MKHIKTFESYSADEKVNEEFIGKLIKAIIGLPLAALSFIVVQFLDARKFADQSLPQLLDIYANLDVLIDTLENIHFNKDVTDVEQKDILDKLNMLKNVKKKYPTIEEYKKVIGKRLGYFNLRNRKYIKNRVMEYEPKKMTADEVIRYIKKVYKLAVEEDIIGEVKPPMTWEERFGRRQQGII